ncbi:MAG: 2-oxoacid:acceptor oxidoreductase subunit alpha [Cyanobacteria bacterium P01_H01_bin.74]
MNPKHDLCWMIGGPQGTGVDSSATLFARSCAVAGYWIYGRREYHSNIKGEHSYFQVRINTRMVQCHIDPVHLLATFENSTAELHAFELVEDGAFIYDPKVTNPENLELPPNALKFPIAFDEILEEVSKTSGKSTTSLAIIKNTIAVSASLALCKIPFSAIEEALEGIFTGKKSKLVPLNVQAAKLGAEMIEAHPDFEKYQHVMAKPLDIPEKGSRYLLNGATATGLAKLKAGCRQQTYYSITPAVDECIYLEDLSSYGLPVIQCEDEIAAVNMAIGGGTTGMRASTSTSGPGFDLMTEGLGWAGINEVPVVVFNYMRGGPSTGLPTRHEQTDLLAGMFSGHGEYPRIVMAPGDAVEQFYDSFEAFNYADRYQTPVIFISDKLLANNTVCVPKIDDRDMKIDLGELAGTDATFDEDNPDLPAALAKFPRFAVTDSGISPRALPGMPGHIYWMTGDEHTEFGHITEEPEIRMAMHEKRMKKLDRAAEEIKPENQFVVHNPYNEADPEITIVSWGSTKGVILDAMKVLKEEHNLSINFLQIRLMSPFPDAGVAAVLKKAKQCIVVESSFGGQITQVIAMRTGIQLTHEVLKYTGRPISETELVAAVQDIKNNQTRKVVLSYGL